MERRDSADAPGYYTGCGVAVAEVARREGIDLIVLFGSAVNGRLRAESDVDVAVRFLGGRPGFETEARVAAELHAALRPPRELDLALLHRASPTLLAEVAGSGVLLYAADAETWPLFKLYARRRFADTAKFRRRRWQALKERYLR